MWEIVSARRWGVRWRGKRTEKEGPGQLDLPWAMGGGGEEGRVRGEDRGKNAGFLGKDLRRGCGYQM